MRPLTKLKHLPLARTVKKISKFFLHSWPQLLLLIFGLALVFTNFLPHTWLLGWDSLHPEINPKLDLQRNLFSVWQEYRGTGNLAGMAHGADLIRALLALGWQSLRLPPELFRYSYTFTCLLLGPLGVSYLIQFLLKKRTNQFSISLAAFLGGLFYLLNPGTVQVFFTPYETFHSFYAAFPWLLLSTFLFFDKRNLLRFIFLTLVSILATPSFYVETIFVVYLLALLPFTIHHFHKFKHKLHAILHITLTFVGQIIPQLFWLLPIVFFVLTNANSVSQAKINLVSSPETIIRNLEYGNLPNLALIKGFWFNFVDLGANQKFDYLLTPWRNHLNTPSTLALGYFFFILSLLGGVFAIKKNLSYAKTLIITTLLCTFILAGGSEIIGSLLPLAGEFFRSPFTKFVVPYITFYSLFFAFGSLLLMDLFSHLHYRYTYLLTTFTLTIGILIYLNPAFSGNLISPLMRVSIPQAYFDLYDFFKTVDPSTRIANFPQFSFWGWQYTNWPCPAEASCVGGGYRGSGFLWYGLKQPILDRAFDVWEKTSEKYYEEVSTALFSHDETKFESVLSKYTVNWLLIDKSIIPPSPNTDTGLTNLQDLVTNNPHFELAKNFDDTLLVYKYKPTENTKNFLSLSNPSDQQTIQPFADLPQRPFTNFDSEDQSISLAATVPAGKLTLPSLSDAETLLPYDVSTRKTPKGVEFLFSPILPKVYLDDQPVKLNRTPLQVNFEVDNPSGTLVLGIDQQFIQLQLPDEINYQNDFSRLTTIYLPSRTSFPLELYAGNAVITRDLTTALQASEPTNCYVNKSNRKNEKISERDQVTLITTDNVVCLSTSIPPASSADQIISLEFVYSSDTDVAGNANITGQNLNSTTIPQPLKPSNQPTFAKLFSRPLFEPMFVNLLLEANELKSTQSITYRQIKVRYYDRLASSLITLPQIGSQTINATQSGTLTVNLPKPSSNLVTTQSPANNLLGEEVRNCDNFNHGSVAQTFNLQGLSLTSTNAIACKQLSLRNLPHSVHYGLILDQQFQSGLASTICFENHSTRRCDVFERLLKSTKPQLVIDPISDPREANGYTLHLFNQSIGKITTSNTFKTISVFPLPLNWLQGISNISPSKSLEGEARSAEGVSSSHPAEFMYFITPRSSQSAVVVNLYQTRSPHWLALPIPENFAQLPLLQQIIQLPILAFQNSSQTIFNQDTTNWYNSYLVPSNIKNLAIFYWPQYLEFVGFALIAILILVLTSITLVKFTLKLKKSH